MTTLIAEAEALLADGVYVGGGVIVAILIVIVIVILLRR
jgi:hypothetical protein